ncbi:hypothetical protein AU106_gp161 [Sinorhizobium phage phiM9]|uniref:Uncharacterized protein n=1 Tax=Sinorhizobium phage phiM9 TaxID=1636182 RepID=A0A0F6R525_9CAUD|nr:hypothetical protein AU106_gp161 [Sinorhizobium phage phiM9]AKE44792.1 hypothetical protein Sm_phiM9_164 [Sinorhizobium phage phiM9]
MSTLYFCYRYVPSKAYDLPLIVLDTLEEAVEWREQNWKRFKTYVSTNARNTIHIIKMKKNKETPCLSQLSNSNSFKSLNEDFSISLTSTLFQKAG